MVTTADLPHFEFWRDGLVAMKRHAIVLLELAGEPVTVCNILAVVESAPQSIDHILDQAWRERSFCARCMSKSYGLEQPGRLAGVLQYFYEYFPGRGPAAQATLVDSFVAILGDLEIQ